MKTKLIKWTVADAKRAEKMGWRLTIYSIVRHGDRFKSDAKAVEWVVGNIQFFGIGSLDQNTCLKAVMLCCGGGR